VNLDLPAPVLEQQQRIRAFVRDEVIPREPRAFASFDDEIRVEVQALAKQAGLWAPQLPTSLGGGGFDLLGSGVLMEEAGYSLLGPLAIHCAAPDEGNLTLLEKVATPDQRERFLVPLANGDVRSAFAMTEPAPGVGSDPRAVRTKAVRTSGGWLISGTKHFITGAHNAGFAIIMATTGDAPGEGVTMFLLPLPDPGWRNVGHYDTLDVAMVGGHCIIELEDAFVPDENVLGEVGEGFRYAQVRLAPARLTHCMRWLGAAQRAHDEALDRALDRELFGRRLTDQGLAQALIADNELDLAASRALLRQACWDVQNDDDATTSSSRAKVFISEAVNRVADRSVQLMGGLGTVVSGAPGDTVVGRIWSDIRAFRIYDGASEVHRMSLAKKAARARRDARMG
jgi:alkylation response protein AidB-like acyl-CoA dehydrogenase